MIKNLFNATVFAALVITSFNSYATATNKTPLQKKQVVAVVNKMVDGKKTWVPSQQTIDANRETEFVVVNTLDAVHGFEIPGLVKPIAIEALETKKIMLKGVPKNTKLKISCFMHPAHVGTTILVK